MTTTQEQALAALARLARGLGRPFGLGLLPNDETDLATIRDFISQRPPGAPRFDGTHWVGCATEGGPRHYECAVREIARLRAATAPVDDADDGGLTFVEGEVRTGGVGRVVAKHERPPMDLPVDDADAATVAPHDAEGAA